MPGRLAGHHVSSVERWEVSAAAHVAVQFGVRCREDGLDAVTECGENRDCCQSNQGEEQAVFSHGRTAFFTVSDFVLDVNEEFGHWIVPSGRLLAYVPGG